MNKLDYELRLKVLFKKVAAISFVIEQMNEQYHKATTEEDRDIYKRMAIMTEGSYEDAKLELITLIAENNQN